jgi:hypothetical protein
MTEHLLKASTIKFSLAVSGNGRLMPRFVQALNQRYRHVIIYDRNEEANRPPSTARIPPHPKVADVDAIFGLSGSRETITLRSRNGHRFFNYDSDPKRIDEAATEFLFRQIVASVETLL